MKFLWFTKTCRVFDFNLRKIDRTASLIEKYNE